MQPRLSGSAATLNCALLRTFVRVVETGNISAAGRSLYLAQSAISAQIASLNRLVGTPLLERVGGRWRTTAAGAIFYQRALEMLQLVERTEHELSAAAGRVTGRIVLGSTRTVTDTILADILHGFSGVHPDVRVDLRAGNRADVERWLAHDDVEVAVVALPMAMRGLEAAPFGADELVAVVSAQHPLATRGEVTIAELADEPLISFERGSGVRALLEERLGERYAALTVRVELNSNDALLSFVERDLGFAFLPQKIAERWARCGGVAAVRISDADLRRELAVVVRRDRGRSRAVETFVDWMAHRD